VDPDNQRARAGLESPEFGLNQLMNP
jgi:hypothetical protein